MGAIRLISDEILNYIPHPTEPKLIETKNYILPQPEGDSLIVAYVSHKRDVKEIPQILLSAIKQNIGVVYVCDTLPKNPLIDKHIHYLVVEDKWFVHTLMLSPLKFSAVFATRSAFKLARAFSEFTKYHIPILQKDRDLKKLVKNTIKHKNSVLIEIFGGLGDHLMTIPSIKTLASKGKNIYILCDAHRNDCFKNLKYVKGFYTQRNQVDISKFKKIIYLNFGQLLNDYRQDFNKQNRIYSVAELCSLRPEDLVIDRPEIILSSDEKNAATKRWGSYNNKIFLGYDSARVDSKLPSNMTQDIVNKLKRKGYTVFIGSVRGHEFQNAINLGKKTTLRELFALIAMMDCVFTVDTSFLHISGAFNKKTFCLMNYFKPEWRCSTYKNCTTYVPKVSCFPCVSKQFVSSQEWQCHKKSCYEFHDIEKVYADIKEYMKDRIIEEPENIPVTKKTYIQKLPKSINENDLPGTVLKPRKDSPVKIAALWMGGIGDSVMLGCLCRAILRKHTGCNVDAFVRDITQSQIFTFDYPKIRGQHSNLSWKKTFDKVKDIYDIVYEFRPYPYMWNIKKPELNKDFDSEMYSNWQSATRYILDNVNMQTFKYYAKSVGLDLLDEDLLVPLIYTENIGNSIKAKYKLPKKYITIGSGCDSNVGILKLWSKDKWELLIKELKSDNIEVIHLGGSNDITFDNINKVSCKNLIDLMYVLKGSSLNVCNEGGLSHLAHSVGTKSIVLFGPTKPELYGYTDNINISYDLCPSCWWTVHGWSSKCKEGNETCINLNKIAVEDVYSEIVKELK